MVKRLVVISCVLLLAALSYGAAASKASAANDMFTVQVTLSEWRVDVSPSTIPAGVPVRFVATNKGVLAHELVLEKAGAVDEALEADLGGDEPLEAEAENIAPGTSKTMIWTLSDAGAYQLACHVPGHFEAGMVMRINATPASTPADQIHTPAPVFVAKGKGGVLAHNYFGKELNFTMDGQEYQIPANSDLFVSLDEDSYTYSANVFGADNTERMGEVDVTSMQLSELSFYR